jgi:Alpha/beta hydrolase domain
MTSVSAFRSLTAFGAQQFSSSSFSTGSPSKVPERLERPVFCENNRERPFQASKTCVTQPFVAFPTSSGDPRRSLEERYPDNGAYIAAIKKAAESLEKQRFLLPTPPR